MKVLSFVLVGGKHHFLHIVPVAAELSGRPGLQVKAYVNHGADARMFGTLLGKLESGPVEIVEMRLPPPLETLSRGKDLKIVRLLAWNRALRSADALVTAERTSTLLKRLPGHCPPMIHLPHGFGDRAKGFEKRHKLFDHIIVAGESIRQRMIAERITTATQCSVSGSIKLAALDQMHAHNSRKLFDNDRPTILYNAHFDHTLGSWKDIAAELIEMVACEDRYNLIVAPHIRMFEQASDAEKEIWRSKAVPGQIVIDLDSDALTDMTYTLAADIYLGDVSSQVYEFLYRPRPCVFVNAHGVKWRDDPNYANWHYGEVCAGMAEVNAALKRATATHPDFMEAQREGFRGTLGDTGAMAPSIAADQLLSAIEDPHASGR
jgi:hypothetical protein